MRVLLILALVSSLAAAQTTAPAPKASPPKPGSSAAPSSSKPAAATPRTPTAPDPDEGSLEDGVYTSDFFRFTYTLPEGFNVDEEFLQDVEDQSNTTFVLLAAEGPLSGEDRRDAVVIAADREATTAEAYVQKVTRDYAQKQNFEILKPAYQVTIGGQPFYRADFRKEGTYQSAVFTILKGYAVGFTMAAPNGEAMQALLDSLSSVKFLPAKSPVPPTSKATPKKAPSPAPKPQ